MASGPRGRKFKSCHSDQQKDGVSRLFLLVGQVWLEMRALAVPNQAFGAKGFEGERVQ